MSVLLLRLAGPMQSWGTRSRFSNRDTGLEPSAPASSACFALPWAGRAKHRSTTFCPLKMACGWIVKAG